MLLAIVSRRASLAAIVTLGLVVSLSGCALGGDDGRLIRAADVAREVTRTSGLALSAAPSPAGLPGLPDLATTLSGGDRTESIVALVFFEASGADRALGGVQLLAGATILRRNNVVVIYRASTAVKNKSAALKRVLSRLADTA